MKKETSMLSDLDIGQKAKIKKLHETNKVIKRHMLDMGITRDTVVTVTKKAPMGDPITISLRDYELTVCKADLNKIEVEVV